MDFITFPVRSRKYPNLRAIVDEADRDLVEGRIWHARRSSGGTFYAYANQTTTLPDGTKRRTRLWLHRLIAGTPDGFETDHKNGDGLDCRRRNLRPATRTQNAQNRAKYQTGTQRSRYKGVMPRPYYPKFAALCRADGVRHYLGDFDTEEEAARAYDEAAKRLHGEFARLNFPDKRRG